MLASLAVIAGFVVPEQAFGQGSTAADRYWQIEFAPKFAKEDRSVQFYRTHQSGSTLEIYDACGENGQSHGTAVEAADGSWAFGSQFGNLKARIGESGPLSLSLDGVAYATGRSIEPVQCENGLPQKIVLVDGAAPTKPRARNAMSASALSASALDHLSAARGVTLPTLRPPPLPALPQLPDTMTPLPNGDTYVCRNTLTPLARIRQLQNVPALGPNALFWPGALLRGASYARGKAAPITIPRSGGNVTVTGVTFSGGAKSSFDAAVMSKEAVQNGIDKLLSQGALSTEAIFDFSTDVVFNEDQMAYSQGVDGRFLDGLNDAIRLDPAASKNYVLARFRQTYYTAALQPPELSYSVFRDGSSFEDPEGQLGADDPPLYVADVGYGRIIFFLVTSPHDGEAVIQALNAAYDAKPDGTAMSGGAPVSYSKILQDSTLGYVVQGGEASAALQTLARNGGVAATYEQLKKIIADERLAQVTASSKGVPVTYTLNYLTSRENASMGFTSAYNQKTCTTVPRRYASFELLVTCIDDGAKITLTDPNGKEILVYTGSQVPNTFNLDAFIPASQRDETFVLRLQDYNIGGPSCLDFRLARLDFPQDQARWMGLDSSGKRMVDIPPATRIYPPRPPLPQVHSTGNTWAVGWISDYRVRINLRTGDVNVTQGN